MTDKERAEAEKVIHELIEKIHTHPESYDPPFTVAEVTALKVISRWKKLVVINDA